MEATMVFTFSKKAASFILPTVVEYLRDADKRKKLTSGLTQLRKVLKESKGIKEIVVDDEKIQNAKTARQKPKAARTLACSLHDAEGEHLETIASNLILLGEPAVKPVLAVLESSDVKVRAQAARILGDIGSIKALVPLIEASGQDNGETREAFENAIRKIIEKNAVC